MNNKIINKSNARLRRFAKLVKKSRQDLKLDLVEFSSKMGISSGTLWRIENARSGTAIEKILIVAEYLKIDI